MKYTVKQIAVLMGMSEHTIRYYTDLNLLPVKRDSGNRRVFDEESINWLMGIKCLKSCGMSIEAIKRYGDLCLQGDGTLAERREIMRSQLVLAEQKLNEAKEVFDYITKKVAHYDDVIAGKTADDTNPATRKIPSQTCD